MQVDKSWQIVPFECAGRIRLGAQRSEVRHIFGSTLRTALKGSGQWAYEIDGLLDFSVQVSYDKTDRVSQVQLSVPLEAGCEGVALLGRRMDDLERDLRRRGHDLACDPLDTASIDCPALGLAFYVVDGVVAAVAAISRDLRTT